MFSRALSSEYTCTLSQLRIEIENKPVILNGGADIPWCDVPFVDIVQFNFKHCSYFLFFSSRTCYIKACADSTGEGDSCSH